MGKKVLPTAEALESVKLLPVFTARLDSVGGVAAAGVDLTVTDPKGKKGTEVKLLKIAVDRKSVV